MFGFLVPKEHKFFDFFDHHAEVCVEGATLFVEMVEHFADAPAKAKRIRDVEHRADDITHHTVELLHKTFITPLDRDHIHSLISTMDDVMDLIHGAAQRMILYQITAPTDHLIELAKVLLRSVQEMQKAV